MRPIVLTLVAISLVVGCSDAVNVPGNVQSNGAVEKPADFEISVGNDDSAAFDDVPKWTFLFATIDAIQSYKSTPKVVFKFNDALGKYQD